MTARARPGGLVIRTAGMAISHERQEFAINCRECHQMRIDRNLCFSKLIHQTNRLSAQGFKWPLSTKSTLD